MAKLFNRAKMTTSTTGTGTITLGSASTGFQTFADAGVSDGDVVQYVIEEGANFEIGTGTYTASGTTLSRTPSESSNSDAAITLAGAAQVAITAVASQIGGGDRDLSFDDNAKAKFGASDDLQIYHNGGNSIIADTGTGDLYVAGDNLRLTNAALSEIYARGYANGKFSLYYDNAEKLATTSTGIDVTGTVTADGLTSAGNILVSQPSSNSSITINRTDSASQYNLTMGQSGLNPYITGNDAQNFNINVDPDNTQASSALQFNIDGNLAFRASSGGDISFYEDTGTTAKFFWDASAESLGIGTSSPSVELSIAGSDPQLVLWEGTDGASSSKVQLGTGAVQGFINIHKGDGTRTVQLNSDGDSYFNGGNVGIGTSSPSNLLHLKDEGYQLKLEDTSSGNTGEILVSDTSLYFFSDRSNAKAGSDIRFGVDGTERMRIDSSGNVMVGGTVAGNAGTISLNVGNVGSTNGGLQLWGTTAGTHYIQFGDDSGTAANHYRGYMAYAHNGDSLRFGTASTERMRIDSSGNVGIGTTSPSNGVSGLHISTASSTDQLYLERTGSATAKWYLGAAANSLYFHDTVSASTRMLIDSSGNVGIGTSSPADKIHTNGGNIQIQNSNASLILTDSGNSNYKWLLQSISSGLRFYNSSGSSEAMRIDSSGNLLVGKTSSAVGTAGHELLSYGRAVHTVNASTVQIINRLSNDGDMTIFQKDGTTVGSIGNRFGAMYVHSPDGTNGAGLRFFDGVIQPCESNGNDSNGDTDLGQINSRFKDLYLSGGVYLGGTGAANKLDDYEEGTWTPTNTGATLTVTRANYTKVGRMVTVSCHVTANANTSGNWGGLPFTIDAAGYHSGSVGYQNDTASEVWNVLADGGTSFTLRKGATSEQLGSGYNMRMTLTYFTT